MVESKLVRILERLNKKQLRRLQDFVSSPYFNKRWEVAKLLDLLVGFHPKYQAAEIEKEKVYKQVHPNKRFDEKDFGYLTSNLVKLIEQFLVIEDLENRPLEASCSLLAVYMDWNLDSAFQQVMKGAQKTMKKMPYRDTDYFYYNFRLSYIENVYFDKKKKHVYDESLGKSLDNLDEYYMATKLRFSCEMLNRSNVMLNDAQMSFLDEITSYLDTDPFPDNPYIAVYGTVLRAMRDESEEKHFFDLKERLITHASVIEPMELRTMYIYGINYCIKKVNMGHRNFLEETFGLYKKLLDSNLIFEGDHISPWGYMNIVVIAIRNKAFEWAEDFIRKYKKHLAPQFKVNAYTYNLAYLFFHKGEFGKAQELLHRVEFDDVYYTTMSKALLLRIFYELQESDALWSLAESFRLYLRRNKLVSDHKKQVFLNLIKFVNRLSKVERGNTRALDKLQVRIEESTSVAHGPWLLEKVEEKR